MSEMGQNPKLPQQHRRPVHLNKQTPTGRVQCGCAISGQSAPQQTARLLDHLVGAQQDRCRQRDAERFGGLEIDREFEIGGLFDRQIRRLRPPKNLGDVGGGD
jgi:hypothetical protein